MSTIPARAVSAIPDRTLPLPAKPNLEFERKRAKRMLRSIAGGDQTALVRIREYRPGILAANVKLSDVQLTIAREYGFSSWPKLMAYYETLDRHERAGPHFQSYRADYYEKQMRQVIRAHAAGQPYVTRGLAAFVPRFYGRSDAEIFATPITEVDAKLVVARMQRFPNWEALIDQAQDEPRDASVSIEAQMKASFERRHGAPLVDAFEAIKRRDLASLERLIDAHPELVQTPPVNRPSVSLLGAAILLEFSEPGTDARAMSDLLVARGADLTTTLGRILLSGFHKKPAEVAFFLDRGADPNWLPPSGVPVLEHALMKYWNPESVDLIARLVTPRKAFWIAAGLGDVQGMLRFLDRNGKPTSAARRHRPDFTLVGFNTPCRPDADDLEIVWEALVVAGFNQRLNTLDALLDRGFPIDYAPWGSTLLSWAEGNSVTALADHLKARGAQPKR